MPEVNEARAVYQARRRNEVDKKINEAVRDALAKTSNPLDITIEEISRQSGVAKTTLYRRFDDRLEMVSTSLFGENYKKVAKKIADAAAMSLFAIPSEPGDDAEPEVNVADELGISNIIIRHGTTSVLLVALLVDKKENNGG